MILILFIALILTPLSSFAITDLSQIDNCTLSEILNATAKDCDGYSKETTILSIKDKHQLKHITGMLGKNTCTKFDSGTLQVQSLLKKKLCKYEKLMDLSDAKCDNISEVINFCKLPFYKRNYKHLPSFLKIKNIIDPSSNEVIQCPSREYLLSKECKN